MDAPACNVSIEGKVSWKYRADILHEPSQSHDLVKSQGLGKLTAQVSKHLNLASQASDI